MTIPPRAVWDDASRASIKDTALKFLRAWLNTKRPRDQWWAEVEKYFDQVTAEEKAHVDPLALGNAQITGEGTIVQNPYSTRIGTVEIPTTYGIYRLMLNRDHGQAPWMVIRITPPFNSRR